MAKKAIHPVELLQEIENRSRSNAVGLPEQKQAKEEWLGIGFMVAGQRLVVPLDEVVEILTMPHLSRVPGVKRWVLGIANVRGNLLPIMDLGGYLTGQQTKISKQTRVLVLDHQGVFSGLLVDGLLGLRHLLAEEKVTEIPKIDHTIVPYLDGSFRHADEIWPIFSMYKLANSPLFMQVSA